MFCKSQRVLVSPLGLTRVRSIHREQMGSDSEIPVKLMGKFLLVDTAIY